jgi:hypothetical protein
MLRGDLFWRVKNARLNADEAASTGRTSVAIREPRDEVDVKQLGQDDELYVFAKSADRVLEQRAMRQRQLKTL